MPEANAAARRREAAALAGHTGDAVGARLRLADPDPGVRATSLGALARLTTLTADDVREALSDHAPMVRRRGCALAIPFAAVDLVPLLDDADASVVEQASWALGERGEALVGTSAVEKLRSVVQTHEDPLCREAAVAALGAIGDTAALATILDALAHDKPAVRRRAVIALAPFDGPNVEAAYEAALTDRDWQVRQAAEDLR